MSSAVAMLDYVADLSPATFCQLFYVLSAAAVLAIAATPDSAQRLLTQYGARSSGDASSSTSSSSQEKTSKRGTSEGVVTDVAGWITSVGKVPHSWFIHFYILSLSCSVFWAVQYVCHGTLLELIMRKQASSTTASMTLGQVVLVWFLMGLQGARRLFEYLAVLQPSSSRMWVVHWLLGNAFYLCTSMAVWVEGSSSISYSDRMVSTVIPPLKVILGAAGFLFAFVMQYKCHRYLSNLKKYSLPLDGLFRYLVCPHYTCECLLYLSLALVAAPEGQLYNRTLVCAVLFVSVNLGVTANGTYKWYIERFGHGFQEKWKMIPYVF
ncbi:Uu.00g057730.m01.CDS01 [Anthostomella pinea]|uniref:Polyprenal reductase n=1 Tax=Anthostomella pinea TaxID=933095 RepID=A0AAI8YM28_9PEZI|nr:Uu.00g057730.m01.CDS01 [Anthostomella pinea]